MLLALAHVFCNMFTAGLEALTLMVLSTSRKSLQIVACSRFNLSAPLLPIHSNYLRQFPASLHTPHLLTSPLQAWAGVELLWGWWSISSSRKFAFLCLAVIISIVAAHNAGDNRISLKTLPIADCIDSCSNHRDANGDLDCGLISYVQRSLVGSATYNCARNRPAVCDMLVGHLFTVALRKRAYRGLCM
jgi:hypothetical protein